MSTRSALSFGMLAVIYSLLFSSPDNAQIPEVPRRCSPPPALFPVNSRTLSEPTAEKRSAATVDSSHRKITIDGITFDSPIHLPDSAVAQIVSHANASDWWTDSSDWIDELVEIGLRGAWQNQGYFRVKATAEAHPLGGDANYERFQVSAHVDEGLQYHLGDIRLSAATGGSPSFLVGELRTAIPLRDGELFDVSKIREGIDKLMQFYGSQGYIDFTATPNIEIDDKLQRISLVMLLDEQKQFRVRHLEIAGREASTETRLRSIVRPGGIYNPQPVNDFLRNFFEENESVLPLDLTVENVLQISRDVKMGTVDVAFDPRPCP
jgi:outer membrane protein assembly factor BamA